MPEVAANWVEIADVPQVALEDAAYAFIRMDKDGQPTPVTSNDVRAVLCALRGHSSLASRYLDSLED